MRYSEIYIPFIKRESRLFNDKFRIFFNKFFYGRLWVISLPFRFSARNIMLKFKRTIRSNNIRINIHKQLSNSIIKKEGMSHEIEGLWQKSERT